MFQQIKNTPRAFAWGRPGAISALLGDSPSEGLEAELWLGAHPGSPAHLADGSAHLAGMVPDLPFLLKVLAAGAPLSLQAHPSAGAARDGFARENAARIPIDAPERNYRDASPKPELLVAVSERFEALTGFRAAADIRTDLAQMAIALDSGVPLEPLVARLGSDESIGDAFLWLLEGGPRVTLVVEILTRWLDTAPARLGYLARIAERHPGDPGIVGALLLHHVVLTPGEALYLPPGNIHAYLDGVGIELMAPSDNVLRGGLTVKHVDVPELARVLDRAAREVPRLEPVPLPGGGLLYAPDDAEVAFSLAAVTTQASIPLAGPAIALCTGGAFTVRGERGSIDLTRGDAIFVTPDEHRLEISGEGSLYLAR